MRFSQIMLLAGLTLTLSHGALATTIRIGLNDDPDPLDPAVSVAFTGRLVLTTACGKLFDIAPDLQIIPQLATSYDWTNDNKTMVIKLRPGLKFDDGEPLDAEAVKYNFERSINLPGSRRKTELSAITSVEVADALTVRVNLKEPLAPLPSILADRAGIMISPKAAKALGENFGSHPVCAGPFKFVSRVAQSRIIFEKSSTYFDADKVLIDRVEFVPVTDTTVRLANLQSGQFDLIERVSPTDIDQIRKDSRFRLASSSDLGYGFLQFNVNNGPRGRLLSDPRLREAIDLSIDREQLVKVAFGDTYLAGNQFVGPTSYFFMKDIPVPKRDVAKAKQLLKDAGQPNLTFKLIARPERDFQVPAQVIQAMLQELGISVIIDTMEAVTMVTMTAKGDFDARLSFFSGRVDPDGNTTDYVACNAVSNYSKYCNPELDRLLTEARQLVDPVKRKAVYGRINGVLLKDRPVLTLWHPQILIAHSTKVRDFVIYSDGLIRLVGVKVE